jgi:hypothetical protein
VGYPLPSCSFKFSQLDSAQRKAINVIISQCGYNRNTHRAIIFGFSSLVGNNFCHLWVEQGLMQATCFLKHWRLPSSQIGQLLRIAVSWFQVALGTRVSFLVDTDTVLPHFKSWLQSLHTFLSHCGGSFSLDNYHIPTLQWDDDCYIMDKVLSLALFTPPQIRRINYCRLYLHVITLSAICTAPGTHFDFEMYYVRIHERSSHTTWHLFTQEHPSEPSWRLWRRACNLFTGAFGQLWTPLGKWHYPVLTLRRRWPCIYSPSTRRYYHWTNTPDNYVTSDTKVPYAWDDCPINSHPSKFLVPGSGVVPPMVVPVLETFSEYINLLPEWEQSALNNIDMAQAPFALCKIFCPTPLMACSDGGALPPRLVPLAGCLVPTLVTA